GPARLAHRGRLASGSLRRSLCIFQELCHPARSWHGFRSIAADVSAHGDGPGTSGTNGMEFRLLRQLLAVAIAAAGLMAAPTAASASAARIKDIVNIEGVRDNQLVGYGLVVGLNGTGDSLNNSPFTRQSLQAMLERLGVNTR